MMLSRELEVSLARSEKSNNRAYMHSYKRTLADISSPADGIPDVVVGSPSYDDVGTEQEHGAIYVLELTQALGVASATRFTATSPHLSSFITAFTNFGGSTSNIGDINQDGHDDLIVGSPRSDASGPDAGSAVVVFMDGSGDVTGIGLELFGYVPNPFPFIQFGCGVDGIGDGEFRGDWCMCIQAS